jgi:hypothetical protein
MNEFLVKFIEIFTFFFFTNSYKDLSTFIRIPIY